MEGEGIPGSWGATERSVSTGFLTVGVTDPWALGLVFLGWPKQAAALPCTLTLP